MITKKQATQLKRAITQFLNAQVNHSWRGGGDPADIPEIEAAAARTAKKLQQMIAELTEPKP